MPDERTPIGPWPWIVGSLLVAMIATSLTFAWVAHSHPDPVIVDEAWEASGRSFAPRLADAGDDEEA